MKDILRIFTCLGIFLALLACKKEVPADQEEAIDDKHYEGLVFQLDSLTRTSINPSTGKVTVNVGDKVKVIYGSSSCEGQVKKSGSKLILQTDIPASAAGPFYAVYPSDARVSLSGEVLSVDVPRVTDGKWADVSLMAAKTTKAQMAFSFKHICSYLSFAVSADDISAGYTKFRLARASGDGKLYGNQKITFDNKGNITLGEQTENTGEYYLVVDNISAAGTYYFPLLAGLNYSDGLIIGRAKDGRGLYRGAIQSIARGHVASCGNICEKIDNTTHNRFYITPNGSGDGSSWENAAGIDLIERIVNASASSPYAWAIQNPYFYLKGKENYQANLHIDSEASFLVIGCYEGSGEPGARDTSAFKTIIRQKSTDSPILSIDGQVGKPTFYGLTFSDASISGTGAAVRIENGSEVRFRACTFQNNTASRHGGAVEINSGANVHFYEGCRFKKNTAKNGGAIHLIDRESQLSVADTRFSGNKGESETVGGGALYLVNGQSDFDNCAFEGNSATVYGGAAHIVGGTHSFKACNFTGNAAANGGAISTICVGSAAKVLLQNGTMTRNVANNITDNMGGGALYLSNEGYVQCDGMTFTGNKVVASVPSRGGAVCMEPDQGCVLMANACIFKGNGFEITGSKAVYGTSIACQNSLGSSKYNDVAIYNSVFTEGYATGASKSNTCSLMLTGSGLLVNSTVVESTKSGDYAVRYANLGDGRGVLYNSIILNQQDVAVTNVSSSGYVITNDGAKYTPASTDLADNSVTQSSLGLNFKSNAFGYWKGAVAGFVKGATAKGAREAVRKHSGIGTAFDTWLLSLNSGIYSLCGNGTTRTEPFMPGAYDGPKDPDPEPEPTDPMDLLANVPLQLTNTSSNHVNYSYASGVYTLTTTGTDPYVYTVPLTANLGSNYAVVYFYYKSSAAVASPQLFYCDPVTAERSRTFAWLSATSEWTKCSMLIAMDKANLSWGKAGDRLRMDFGSQSGVTLQIKDLRIRVMTEGEQAVYEGQMSVGGDKNAQAQHIANYLAKSWPCSITSVSVTSSNVTISGKTDGKSTYFLTDFAPYDVPTEMTSFTNRGNISGTTFTLTMPRTVSRNGYTYDYLLSRWAIVRSECGFQALASHARYADQVQAVNSPGKLTPKNKKGIGGLTDDSLRLSDIDELGLGTITWNVVMDWLISPTADHNFTEAYTYCGKTYYINAYQRAQYDKLLKFCLDRSIVVCGIVLFNVQNTTFSPSTAIMKHPEYVSAGAADGTYTMPNMTTAQAVHLYAAAMDFLCKRYSTSLYGRVHHWIMHNEVDYAREWTNMGDQPEWRYMDTYLRSMRLCYNIARQYDQNLCPMISLTHCWNKADGQYKGKSLLDDMLTFSAKEGDFPWGVAYHSYPQNLMAPRFWNDDTQSTYSASSSYCTFKNLEVIDNWARNSQHFYKGAKRLVFLSENGTNSPTYAQSDLILQAAGACWAWKKVSALSGIDGIHWHNWRDDTAEGGLLIGLRSAPSNNSDPKQAWVVWKYAGTSREDEFFAPYLSTIGISSWSSIMHPF